MPDLLRRQAERAAVDLGRDAVGARLAAQLVGRQCPGGRQRKRAHRSRRQVDRERLGCEARRAVDHVDAERLREQQRVLIGIDPEDQLAAAELAAAQPQRVAAVGHIRVDPVRRQSCDVALHLQPVGRGDAADGHVHRGIGARREVDPDVCRVELQRRRPGGRRGRQKAEQQRRRQEQGKNFVFHPSVLLYFFIYI